MAPSSESAGAPAGRAVLTPQQQERLVAKLSRGLSARAGGGVTVDEAPPGTVTGELGFRPGDVIVSMNTKPINSPADFARVYLEDGKPRQIEFIHRGETIHRHP